MKKLFVTFCMLAIPYSAFANKSNTCAVAYSKIKRSDIASLKKVESACNSQVQPTCEAINDKNGFSGSDGELVLMGCALRSSYSANVKAGNGRASESCEKAVLHIYSPTTSVVEESAVICLSETELVCNSQTTELAQASCRAESAYAAYVGTNGKKFKLPPELEKAAQDTSDAEMKELLKQFGISK